MLVPCRSIAARSAGKAAAARGGRRDGRPGSRRSRPRSPSRRRTASARFQVVAREGRSARPRRDFKQAVIEQRLDGYLDLPADVARDARRRVLRQERQQLQRPAQHRGHGGRGAREPAPGGRRAWTRARVKSLTRELDLKTIRLSETGEREDRGAAIFLALILLMILYASILMWGQAVLTGVIEEKTSRVVEVMAVGVPSTTLLLGQAAGRRRRRPHAVPGLGGFAVPGLARRRARAISAARRCPRSRR